MKVYIGSTRTVLGLYQIVNQQSVAIVLGMFREQDANEDLFIFAFKVSSTVLCTSGARSMLNE